MTNVSQAISAKRIKANLLASTVLANLSISILFSQPTLAQFTTGSTSNPSGMPFTGGMPSYTGTPATPSGGPGTTPIPVPTVIVPSTTRVSPIPSTPSLPIAPVNPINSNAIMPNLPRELAPSVNTLIPTNLQTHSSESRTGKNLAAIKEANSIEWSLTYRNGSKAQFMLDKTQPNPPAACFFGTNAAGVSESSSEQGSAQTGKQEKSDKSDSKYWQNLLKQAEEKKKNGSKNPYDDPEMLKLWQREESGESLNETEKKCLHEWFDKCADFLSAETAKAVRKVSSNSRHAFDALEELLEGEKLKDGSSPEEKLNGNANKAFEELNKLLKEEQEKDGYRPAPADAPSKEGMPRPLPPGVNSL